MKTRISLIGGLVLLALVAGAFFLVPRGTQAAATRQTVIVLHKNLAEQKLVGDVPTIVLSTTFESNHAGVFSLRTIQGADLGISGPGGRYSGGRTIIGVMVKLDGQIIDTQIIGAHRYYPVPKSNYTSIGIFITKYITPGEHTLLVSYGSTYSGLADRCYDPQLEPVCGATQLTRGTALLVTPFYRAH